MNLTDRLDEVGYNLAKYPGDTEDDAFNRRLLLRKAFTEYGDERFQEGYLAGRRDMTDARAEAQRRVEAAAAGDPQ